MILYNGTKALIHSTNSLRLETSWGSLLVIFREKIRENLDLCHDDEEACASPLGLLLFGVILGFAPQFPLLTASSIKNLPFSIKESVFQ